MAGHTITQTDDGKHCIRDADGRIPEITVDPNTGARATANGFDSAGEAREAAKDAGLEVSARKPEGPARTATRKSGGGASKAAKRSGARRN